MNDFEGVRVRALKGGIPANEQSYNSANDFQGVRVRALKGGIPEGDSWGDLAWKSPLQGLVGLADLPANLLGLAERGGRKALGFLREQSGQSNNIDNGRENDFFSHENTDRPSKWINAAADKLGIDITPRPTTAGQRIFSHAGEFAGSIGPWGAAGKGANLLNKGANAVKLAGTGAAIGGTSGVLQEGGVNPLAADLLSIFALPTAARGISNAANGVGNLFSNFTKAGQDRKISSAASDILKDKVGEKNIGKVLENLNAPTPFNAPLTTAERAQNTGISTLHRALTPNIPAIAEKEALTDSILRKELGQLSPKAGLEPYQQGEAIRSHLERELQNRISYRSDIAKPLYDEVYNLKNGVELPNTRAFLEESQKYAKGDIKKNLDYVENIIRGNGAAKEDLSALSKFKKENPYLSNEAMAKIESSFSVNPIPAELVNAVKDISGRIGKAKRSGNNELAYILEEAKSNILKDLVLIPEEALARNTYATLSKPVSAIEKQPLLSKFVKKDLYNKEFLLSPEKIPNMILQGSLNDTKALIREIGADKKTIDIARGSVVDKLINSSELSSANAAGQSNLSYNKVNNFLNKNKEKLKYIFNEDQVKVLDEVKEVLKRRNMVATMGRGVGSNTQSQTTLLEELTNPVRKSLFNKFATQIPGGNVINSIFDIVKNYEKQQIKNLLEKALLDPETAKLLLTPVNSIKSPESLKSILIKIGIPASANSLSEELQRREYE